MSRWVLLQAFYCISGILFFIQDLFAHKPMGEAMLNAFIWPYAQWPVIQAYATQLIAALSKLIS